MSLRLSFNGSAGEVTGSRHLFEAEKSRLLLDYGLFQGHRHESIRKNRELPYKAGDLSAVLLSHSHIDHSGALPLLAKAGLRLPIHCTAPAREICAVLLMDSAHLQEEDAKFFNKIHAGEGQAIAPLYDSADVEDCLKLFAPHPYREEFSPSSGVTARFLNAGHVLGSAIIQLDAATAKGPRRLAFTGDLGRRHPFLETPPEIPKNVDYLIIESTYGGRRHDPVASTEARIKEILERAAKEKGRVIIPSFALERTQELVFILARLAREKAIPKIPVYVDSPMATAITTIFEEHARRLLTGKEVLPPGRHWARISRPVRRAEGLFQKSVLDEPDPFGLDSVRYVRSVEESKSLNDLPGPLVIISASGMCEGGRVLHHLRNNVDKENTAVVLVGYQAEGTLGRRLQEGAKKVKIFGLEHEVWARVETIHGFSAHADQSDLLWFIKSLDPRPRQIFLVHGDPQDRETLTGKLRSEGITRVVCPQYGESFSLD